jgi:hypothetical protein
MALPVAVSCSPRLFEAVRLRGCVLDSAPRELATEEEVARSGPEALAAHLSATFGGPSDGETRSNYLPSVE